RSIVTAIISTETASARIPIVALSRASQEARETLEEVKRFVNEKCIPADAVFSQSLRQGPRERFAAHPQVLEDLKTEARQRGLWNLFLARDHYGVGSSFSNLEYGLMAEQLGRSQIASEVSHELFCTRTGNMEVLATFGNEDQKRDRLEPLLDGKIRSAFLMTEPAIASSDATNIEFSMRRNGGEYVLTGSKWWSSGAGDPRSPIASSRCFSFQRALQVSQFIVCCQFSGMMTRFTATVTSPSTTFVCRRETLS
ncbi:hypothetical protein ACHAQH_008929, partial [Verticillium albo-atrum]